MTEQDHKKLGNILWAIAEELAQFSTSSDTLGDAYEYLIGQLAPSA